MLGERTIAVVLLIMFLMSPAQGWTEEGADPSSALHVLAGLTSSLLVSAVAYPLVDLGSNRDNALVVAGLGLGGAFVVGLTKELLDLSGWGQPELADLLLTVGGGLLAGTLVYAVTCLQSGSEAGNLWISGVYGAFALILSLPVGEDLLRRTKPSLRSRS